MPTSDNSLEYYRMRKAQCLSSAEAAGDKAARIAHLKLADLYQEWIDKQGGNPNLNIVEDK